ncbi:hypothetical protein [Hymenobacter sediminicola]|uniref:Uncharacterized protein n=1 Tax=Hymenobacter sediminicola TaxID=2761579 RepID=A0A7G7W6W3_9BACT|nr:hypothetical protein [Hymenobacter sediminicola]QNH62106.1 hypothetical protein H4317_18480 [Hymenobacter sediminicola]
MPPIPTPEMSHSTAVTSNLTGTGPEQLQIGEYLIGSGDCPQLYGHPDIRY